MWRNFRSFGRLCVQFKVVVFTSVNSLNRGNALLLCTKMRIENGVRSFGFPTDDEGTENGAIYKPEVSSLHDLVSNSTVDRGCPLHTGNVSKASLIVRQL